MAENYYIKYERPSVSASTEITIHADSKLLDIAPQCLANWFIINYSNSDTSSFKLVLNKSTYKEIAKISTDPYIFAGRKVSRLALHITLTDSCLDIDTDFMMWISSFIAQIEQAKNVEDGQIIIASTVEIHIKNSNIELLDAINKKGYYTVTAMHITNSKITHLLVTPDVDLTVTNSLATIYTEYYIQEKNFTEYENYLTDEYTITRPSIIRLKFMPRYLIEEIFAELTNLNIRYKKLATNKLRKNHYIPFNQRCKEIGCKNSDIMVINTLTDKYRLFSGDNKLYYPNEVNQETESSVDGFSNNKSYSSLSFKVSSLSKNLHNDKAIKFKGFTKTQLYSEVNRGYYPITLDEVSKQLLSDSVKIKDLAQIISH